MGNKRIRTNRLDPMTKTTPDEVALVIEQGNRYLQAISSKRQKLYRMCETFNETIEGVSLKEINYDRDAGSISSDAHDVIMQILQASKKQLKEHEKTGLGINTINGIIRRLLKHMQTVKTDSLSG